MLQQLIDARIRYVKLNYKETTALIQNSKETPHKKIGLYLAWMDQSMKDEI